MEKKTVLPLFRSSNEVHTQTKKGQPFVAAWVLKEAMTIPFPCKLDKVSAWGTLLFYGTLM